MSVGYWKRRWNRPFRAHGVLVTSVTAFMHPSDTSLLPFRTGHLGPPPPAGALDGAPPVG
ncbi:hypothetical protein GCM10018771_54320 [Streptomyces cellulosae]|nr:hypothetical protein GCM10018771_54320 [Streptomyces cellulosae]